MNDKVKMTCAICDTDITGATIEFYGDKYMCQDCAEAVFYKMRDYRKRNHGRMPYNAHPTYRYAKLEVRSKKVGSV